MAKVITIQDIDMLGKTYYVEEKSHEEIVECQSGTFVKANLYFLNVKQ